MTRYPPGSMFAVRSEARAVPDASVPTSTAFEPLDENVPLGPLAGAVKLTAIPRAAW